MLSDSEVTVEFDSYTPTGGLFKAKELNFGGCNSCEVVLGCFSGGLLL